MTSLVFDTTALSHLARAGRTDEPQVAAAGDEPVLLAEVAAGWLKCAELQELPEFAAFARYEGELSGGQERNNGPPDPPRDL